MKTASRFLGDSDFIMYLGDNLIGEGVNHLIERFEEERLDVLILLKEDDDPTRFGVAVLDETGNIVKLVERLKSLQAT